MSDTSRFSQAQVLIAALFSIVLTGDSGFEFLPDPIVPLSLHFGEVCRHRYTGKYLSSACGLERPSLWYLVRAEQRPRTVIEWLQNELDARGYDFNIPSGNPDRREITESVASKLSLQTPYVRLCWDQRYEIDAKWELCHTALQNLAGGAPPKAREIRNWHNGTFEIASALGMDSHYVQEVARGWATDPLVRAALRAVQHETSGPLFANAMKNKDLDSFLAPYRTAIAERNGGTK